MLSRRIPDWCAGPVEEEVFENERYQPFRAWGHTWPGHFLPTDRVGHWSVEGSAHNPLLDSASFDAMAPALKKVHILLAISNEAAILQLSLAKQAGCVCGGGMLKLHHLEACLA